MTDQPDPLDFSLQARLKRLALHIINTRYLFIAVLIHLVLLAFVGTKVIYDRIEAPPAIVIREFVKTNPVLEQTEPPRPKPSETTEQPPIPHPAESGASEGIPPERILLTAPGSKNSDIFPRGQKNPLIDTLTSHIGDDLKQHLQIADRQRLQEILDYTTGGDMKRKFGSSKNDPIAEFTCYVGQYHDGDWNCNLGYIVPAPPAKDGKWYGNCMVNLMLQTQRWSKDHIKAKVQPEYLDLGDRQWLDVVHPPFIFITGHKDFKFTPAEAVNLREYLRLGGCLWVDNALPGRKSRFDIALRREMHKVLPDCDFQKISTDHPIYQSRYHFKGGSPAGMNFYKEPVEVIKLCGDVGVIYTLNAYSDLWETALSEKNEVDATVEWIPDCGYVYRWGPHWHYNASGGYKFFRNVSKESVNAAYQFGVNIVVYLITRFDDKLKNMHRTVST